MLIRVKKQWVPRAWMIFNVLSLLYIVVSDFLFALYVNNVPMTYAKFDAYRITVDNISFLLLFPVSLFLWKFLKLRDWSVKKVALAYTVFGILAPFLFLPSFASRYGQISWEYAAFSSTVLSNLAFKLMMLALLLLVVWPLLINTLSVVRFHRLKQLKTFLITLGLSIGSLVLALGFTIVLSWQLLSLLDRILLPQRIGDSVPTIIGYTNQKIIITDYPAPLLRCYLSEHQNDVVARFLQGAAGSSFFNKPGYNSYYLNNNCLVAYIGENLQFQNETTIKHAAILSELLIRTVFGDHLKRNAETHPFQLISIKSEEFSEDGGGKLGTYDPDTNSIVLHEGYNYTFEVVIHEELHAFAATYESWLGYEHSGIGEAVTQYLTGRVLNNLSNGYGNSFYQPQVEALQALLPFVDEDMLLDAYFNGNLKTLEKSVDGKTYRGAFCRFNDELDRSMVEWLDTKNFTLAKEYAKNAAQALTTKKDDATTRCKTP